MVSLEFTKDMELGVESIDNQHKSILERLAAIADMDTSQAISNEDIKKTVEFLADYVIQHFRDEEALQLECDYPKHSEHKKEHELFLEEFVEHQKEFERTGYSAVRVLELNLSIIDWVVRHVKGSDVEFGRYYRASKARS